MATTLVSTFPTESFYQDVARRYPEPAATYYARDARRMSFQASLVFEPGKVFVDVGSGLTPLAFGLQLLGMRTTMVDRFDYPVDRAQFGSPEGVVRVLEDGGVRLAPTDIALDRLPLDDCSVDSVSCVACIEHLHSSPRPLFAEIKRILKPEGQFLLGCPNATNLRKRFSVLLGRSNLPAVDQFWTDGDPVWHGHVREPTISELQWMAEASGLEVVSRLGRNFIGEENYGWAASLLDQPLRRVPGLCSDIYVLARKPRSTN